jgi:hypothetical protein
MGESTPYSILNHVSTNNLEHKKIETIIEEQNIQLCKR